MIARLLDISEAQVQRSCFSARIRLCQVIADAGSHRSCLSTPAYFFLRRSALQPSLIVCLARPSASASSGTSSVMHDPAAI